MKFIIFLKFFILLYSISFFAKGACISTPETSRAAQISLAKVKEVNNSERAYFYKYANGVCKEENLFIIPGDRVIAYKNLNGYDYVAYLTKNGDTVSGWIENNRLFDVYSSYFKLHVCWLSSLTPVTYWCKLLGTLCVAAFLQLELFSV